MHMHRRNFSTSLNIPMEDFREYEHQGDAYVSYKSFDKMEDTFGRFFWKKHRPYVYVF